VYDYLSVRQFVFHLLEQCDHMLVYGTRARGKAEMIFSQSGGRALTGSVNGHVRLVLIYDTQRFLSRSVEENMDLLVRRFCKVQYEVHMGVAQFDLFDLRSSFLSYEETDGKDEACHHGP